MENIYTLLVELETATAEGNIPDMKEIRGLIDRIAPAVKVFGKIVAKDVRHLAAEQSLAGGDPHSRIMNLQYDPSYLIGINKSEFPGTRAVQDLLDELEEAILAGAYEPSERGAGYTTDESCRAVAKGILNAFIKTYL